jgi:hypothetical protein
VKLLIVDPLEGASNQVNQLVCSANNGLIQGGCLISDCDGVAANKAGFDHAAHIVMAALLVTVLIAQVNIHLRDVFTESAESILYYAADMCDQRLMSFDVVVGIDLDLHGVLLL